VTSHERAIQIYQVLVGMAHNRQTITYGKLSELTGIPTHGMAPRLDHLMRYCAANKLPPLTVLVVQKDSGKPGQGLVTTMDTDADRERVFAYNWYKTQPLTTSALEASEDAQAAL
jgi:hypothetical protein